MFNFKHKWIIIESFLSAKCGLKEYIHYMDDNDVIKITLDMNDF